ncbi:MAG: 4-hydroxy-tetrahydrodipicolinate synthase [Acutalibacteraceae bacterium]|nr:4-hydroxy-tetrahydrodipicolinate synthase [Acutalibacteraceae bacterium]
MKKTIFTGSGVAIITPMNQDGTVNYEKIKEIIDFQIENGTDAIITCGTTGESATMSHKEHEEVMKFMIDYVNKRVPVIAGTGSNETYFAAELSQYAEKCGADALLLVTPYYNKTSQEGLIAHFNYIADRVNIPIILYNVPSRTGLNIQPATYKELCKHPNIVAAKEASGDISQVAKIAQLCGDELDIYSGNDDQIVPILSLGGKGVISVLANVCPKETHQICEEFFNGNIEKSRELQLEYLDLINNLFCEVNPTPVKEAMNMMGMQVGDCRLPLVRPTDANQKKIFDSLKNHGLIK